MEHCHRFGLQHSKGRVGVTAKKKRPTKQRERKDRRSISVKGITYQRLKDYCDAQGRSVSGYLEEILAEKLDAAGAPVPTKLRHKPRKKKVPVEDIVSQHFTF